MIRPDDMAHCRAAIRTGSLSFHAASRLLPADVRDPALALYAFCRLADDEVDEGRQKARAVLRLQDRLDRVYAGRPFDAPEDRAFAGIVEAFNMPRALPDALLEGLAWDAQERRYDTLSDVRAYSARVASAVGAMMCVLMHARAADTLARACDLGVAMQLTNIARDVGEDARAGRLYLPDEWMQEAGLSANDLAGARPPEGAKVLVQRLLREADRLYLRSEAGIGELPRRARMGIWAARLIYDGIGGAVRRNGYDSVSMRARTNKLQKLGWLGQSAARAVVSTVTPRSPVLFAPPLPETAFLVHAAAGPARPAGRAQSLIDVLATLAEQEAIGQMRRPG